MTPEHTVWVLIVGIVILLAAALDSAGKRIGLPPIVCYFGLGIGLGAVESRFGLLGEQGLHVFGFLADLGIVTLLFHVGLSSHLGALLEKLRPASRIWAGNVLVSGVLGFSAAYFSLDLPVAASLVVATALTATSIAVSSAVWSEAGALDTPNGRLVLDVAELDDISGVALMALVFAMVPALLQADGHVARAVAAAGLAFVVKFALFATLCYVFARHLEERLTRRIARLRHVPQRMLAVAGAGFVIAAIASGLGFSLAIGALFAGLVFSRDPDAVRTDVRFADLHAFFTPFFFIGVGLHVDLASVHAAWWPGLVLFVAAVVGKVLGGGLPALGVAGLAGATLIGVSLVPRAEIALVIAHQGRAIGALTEATFAALVIVSALTCLLSPWVLNVLLRRWPQA